MFIQKEWRCCAHGYGNVAESRGLEKWERNIRAVFIVLAGIGILFFWELEMLQVLVKFWVRLLRRSAKDYYVLNTPKLPSAQEF